MTITLAYQRTSAQEAELSEPALKEYAARTGDDVLMTYVDITSASGYREFYLLLQFVQSLKNARRQRSVRIIVPRETDLGVTPMARDWARLELTRVGVDIIEVITT